MGGRIEITSRFKPTSRLRALCNSNGEWVRHMHIDDGDYDENQMEKFGGGDVGSSHRGLVSVKLVEIALGCR